LFLELIKRKKKKTKNK